MKAVAITPGVSDSLALVEMGDPHIGDHDVLVETTRVGVCGTDQELKQGLFGQAPTGSDYLVIGHEALGRVVGIGSQVTDIEVGDYVVASVRRPCPRDWCVPCRNDQNDMCITGEYTERGIMANHGYLAELYGEHEQHLTKIPAELEDVGVLLEPMSVVEKALRQSFKIQERLPWSVENAVVLGAGAIGLLAAMLLRLRGIDTYVIDRTASKSGIVSQFGAHLYDTSETPLPEVADKIGRIDFIMEATGFAPLVIEASQHLASNGLLCLVGLTGGTRDITIDINELNNRLVLGNRLVFGSVNANSVDFRSGVDHLLQIQRRWPGVLERVITRRIPFTRFEEAFEPQLGNIKTVIEMGA